MPATPISESTPVLVGVAAIQQREEDPRVAREPVALMAEALERAADDAGSRALLERADRIYVPQGMWSYPDPGRLIADRIGAQHARSIFAEIGILQTELFGRAAHAIATGAARIVLVTGGEARYRELRAQIAGIDVSITAQPDGARPDELLTPDAGGVQALEGEHGLQMPVTQYAIIENALRHAEGMSLADHRRTVAELWAAFSTVAASNPMAWNPSPRTADDIATPSARNRMLAFPYNKLHCTGWNVDQAAALVFCSAATAREMGVPEDRWIFPLAVVDSNHMTALSERPFVGRSPGFALAGRRLVERTGIGLDTIDHVELYSCFPAAVRVQCLELGLSPDRPLSVTGGMPFAGGPLNNFVLQALVRMTEVLRAAPGSTGLLTAISGIITKQGLSLWRSGAPERPFVHEDVGTEVAATARPMRVVANRDGAGTVTSYTVLCEGGEPRTGVALVNFSEEERTIASTVDAGVIQDMMDSEFCGRRVRVGTDGTLKA
jgi:acetyl-CoA C-acetyltransferase